MRDRPNLIRVLILDDHVLLRAGVRALLQAPDIDVVAHSGVADALGAIERERPTVVTVAMVRPVDAVAVTQGIAADPAHPPVIAVTIPADGDHLASLLRAGANAYLTGDIGEGELLDAVRAVAGGDVYAPPRSASDLAAELRPRAMHPASRDDDIQVQLTALSDREQAVLRLVAEGYSGPEIGRSLGITAKTVDTYRSRIHQKIGLGHRAAYVRFALNADLLTKGASGVDAAD